MDPSRTQSISNYSTLATCPVLSPFRLVLPRPTAQSSPPAATDPVMTAPNGDSSASALAAPTAPSSAPGAGSNSQQVSSSQVPSGGLGDLEPEVVRALEAACLAEAQV